MDTVTVDEHTFQAVRLPTETTYVMAIRGGQGMLGCGYLDVSAADRLGEALVIVKGVKTYEDMLAAPVAAASQKARERGVTEAMTGREALLALA